VSEPLVLPETLERAAAANARGDLAEAEALCRRILAARADYFDALHLFGVVQSRRGQRLEALASYDKALAIRPDHAEALNNRGIALKDLKRFEDAVASYDKALAVRPAYAKAYYNRGVALYAMNRWREANASYARAVELQPDYAAARFALCMSELPMVYADDGEIAERREAYARRLTELCAATDESALAAGMGSTQPYYLAYQAQNDRELQAQYGALLCRLAASRYGSAAMPPPRIRGEKLRVGFVSGFFRMHSVWKIPLGGWLAQLDRSRFRVFGYHTAKESDAVTEAAEKMCERFVRGPLSIERWRELILADAPHVLIYPEIGMDGTAPALAAQCLAPVQCNAGGHPVTSGLPTVDYFLSSNLMEPPDGEQHYTERLVRLPNLMIYYDPPEPSKRVTRANFGLPPGATLFWCGQTTAKFLPQFDAVFARIARAAGDCQFVFVEHSGGAPATEVFRRRLDHTFADAGLRAADHCVFLPRMEMGAYIAAMGMCDIFLDSIGWSGNNTAMESLAHNLPIVTWPGSQMRGRHSAAILWMIGVTETIAASLDDYVTLAVRLARESDWRRSVVTRMAANKHRAYRDRAAIAGLEQFLIATAAG
jgi:protein O-GlcNAc transferase